MLSFTPPERLTDARGRPYFLWDCDLTIEELRARLEDPDPPDPEARYAPISSAS